MLIAFILCSSLLSVVAGAAPSTPSGHVVTLTDANFDEQLASNSRHPWFISVGAPWCPHCRELEPTWKALAERLKGEVHVAKIDGNSERIISTRLAVEVFPSLFFIRGEETRPYHEARTLIKLVEFATHGWRDVDALPQNRSPTSQYGRAIGILRMLPYRAGELFQQLQARGYSQLSILLSVLAIPVTAGLLFICALDSYYTRSAAPLSVQTSFGTEEPVAL